MSWQRWVGVGSAVVSASFRFKKLAIQSKRVDWDRAQHTRDRRCDWTVDRTNANQEIEESGRSRRV